MAFDNGKFRAIRKAAAVAMFFSNLLMLSTAINPTAGSENGVLFANASDVSVHPNDIGTTESIIFSQQEGFPYELENKAKDTDESDNNLNSNIESSALIHQKSTASQADSRNNWSFLYLLWNPSGIYAFVGTCVIIALVIAAFKAFGKTIAFGNRDFGQIIRETVQQTTVVTQDLYDVETRMYP